MVLRYRKLSPTSESNEEIQPQSPLRRSYSAVEIKLRAALLTQDPWDCDVRASINANDSCARLHWSGVQPCAIPLRSHMKRDNNADTGAMRRDPPILVLLQYSCRTGLLDICEARATHNFFWALKQSLGPQILSRIDGAFISATASRPYARDSKLCLCRGMIRMKDGR